MVPELPRQLALLIEAAEQLGYSWKTIDPHSNNLIEVSNGKQSFFANNGSVGVYPTNRQFSAGVVKDKAWTKQILRRHGFTIIEGDYAFIREEYREMRGDGKERPDALAYAKQLGYPVFVKPNDKTKGIGAAIVYDETQLNQQLDALARLSHIALIEKVIDQPEYRLLVVNGRIEYAYRKEPARLIGDGIKTIADLLTDHNQKLQPKYHVRDDNTFFQQQLKENGYRLASVLPKNESLFISAANNLSTGARLADYTEQFTPACRAWTKRLVELFGLSVCGLDIFSPSGLDDPVAFTVIEINQNPHLAGIYDAGKREKVLAIFTTVLREFFHE